MSFEKTASRGSEASRIAELEERNRLQEHQLEYLRMEMLHLVHERERMIYSASWHVFRPLRRLETKLVDFFCSLRRAFAPHAQNRREGPVSRPSSARAALGAQLAARRLLVDVTGTVKHDAGTGIQRVVKKVAQALLQDGSLEIPALIVRCEGGRLFTCREFVASLTQKADSRAGQDEEVSIEPGDRFLMISDSWNAFDELSEVCERIRSGGGEVVSCIFDLIPELYPHACHEVTVPSYRAWLRKALVESDSFIAISRTVGEELASYVEERGLPHRPGLKIGWFHCGSDISTREMSVLREEIRAATEISVPVFLCVGTIEPRKGHRTALRAFDQLWNGGLDVRLVFIGKRGWYDEAVVAEILAHPEYGNRLFWFDDMGDAELSALYEKASAVLLPSYAEGFGLPIVEAARRGRPVICSDIPVFREVAGNGAAFFRVNDPHAMADCVRGWLAGTVATDASKVSRSSWADSARRIMEVVAREDWEWRLP